MHTAIIYHSPGLGVSCESLWRKPVGTAENGLTLCECMMYLHTGCADHEFAASGPEPFVTCLFMQEEWHRSRNDRIMFSQKAAAMIFSVQVHVQCIDHTVGPLCKCCGATYLCLHVRYTRKQRLIVVRSRAETVGFSVRFSGIESHPTAAVR